MDHFDNSGKKCSSKRTLQGNSYSRCHPQDTRQMIKNITNIQFQMFLIILIISEENFHQKGKLSLLFRGSHSHGVTRSPGHKVPALFHQFEMALNKKRRLFYIFYWVQSLRRPCPNLWLFQGCAHINWGTFVIGCCKLIRRQKFKSKTGD